MATSLKIVSILLFVTAVTIGIAVIGTGQGEPPASPVPPPAQRGHPSGKLVIWGDLVNFDHYSGPSTLAS